MLCGEIKMHKPEERENQILQILASHPKIYINSLQKLTHFSTSTLRRDLVRLEDKGLIQRSFGSIRLLNQENLEYTWEFRKNNSQHEKEKICSIASSFIEDNDAIFIDSSTTCIKLLNYLGNLSGLKVITNNLKVAQKIQSLPQVSGFISGGELKPLSQSVIGIDTVKYLSQFHARLAFISPSTIDTDGLYMANIEQTQIKRTMLVNSNIVLALIDHTKFNSNNDFIKLCDLDYLDYLITDRPIPDGQILRSLKKNRVNIIYKRIGRYSHRV